MDQRLKDFAALVGRLLAERWYKLQQEKKRSTAEPEASPTIDKGRGPTAVDSC